MKVYKPWVCGCIPKGAVDYAIHQTNMLEQGKNLGFVSALSLSQWYVTYFCLDDAVLLVSILSFFLLVTTYYIVVNKPLSSLT